MDSSSTFFFLIILLSIFLLRCKSWNWSIRVFCRIYKILCKLLSLQSGHEFNVCILHLIICDTLKHKIHSIIFILCTVSCDSLHLKRRYPCTPKQKRSETFIIWHCVKFQMRVSMILCKLKWLIPRFNSICVVFNAVRVVKWISS